jgi:hypothetical protein
MLHGDRDPAHACVPIIMHVLQYCSRNSAPGLRGRQLDIVTGLYYDYVVLYSTMYQYKSSKQH